jgi:sarcosine oxidase subunit beta
MSNNYDVIVIGAGIMGCSSAFHLASRGLEVVLLEQGIVGESPSSESSAIIRQHYSNELTARMALHCLHVFQNFSDLIGGECGYSKTGVVMLVGDQDHSGLEANIDLQQSLGIRTSIIDAHLLRDIIPGIIVPETIAASYEPEGGYADPYLTVTAFAKAGVRNGVEIHQDTKVVDILFEGDKVSGVRTSTADYFAPLVLNTAGAWGAQVARMANVEAPINACRVQVAFFRGPEEYAGPHPVVGDFVNASYFRSETGGLTLSGLIDPAEAEAIVDPDNYNKNVDFGFVADVGERLVRRYMPMAESENTGGFASLYAITPDWHPIIDEVPKGSGFFLCSGFSGHGFKLGPAIGLLIADMITGVSEPEFDVSSFRYNRFEEDDLVQGQYEYSILG